MTETGETIPPPEADDRGPIVAHDTDGASSTVVLSRPPRTGEMTAGWRVVTAVCWIGVIGAFAAIWNTSERLGLSTWWLGPRGDPMPMAVRLLPFVAPTFMVLATTYNVRWLWRWGVGASLVTAVFGIADIDGFSGLAALQLSVAVAALVISLASATGTYRPVHEGGEATLG